MALPVELRAGLDLLAGAAGAGRGWLRARVIGRPELVEELARYAPIEPCDSLVIALGTAPATLYSALSMTTPARVLTLVEGNLARPLRPFRSAPRALGADLPGAAWRALGYGRADTHGFQGAGALGWAAGERALRRLRRSDLADRCRIAMLLATPSARFAPALATVIVREYRRER